MEVNFKIFNDFSSIFIEVLFIFVYFYFFNTIFMIEMVPKVNYFYFYCFAKPLAFLLCFYVWKPIK